MNAFHASLLHHLIFSMVTLGVAYGLVSATLLYWDLYKTYQLPVDLICSAIPLICLVLYAAGIHYL